MRLQTWHHDVQGSCLVHSIVTTQWITTNTALIWYIPCLTFQWFFPCIFDSCNKFQRISATSFLPATWNNKSHRNLNSTNQLATKHSPFVTRFTGVWLGWFNHLPRFFFSTSTQPTPPIAVINGVNPTPNKWIYIKILPVNWYLGPLFCIYEFRSIFTTILDQRKGGRNKTPRKLKTFHHQRCQDRLVWIGCLSRGEFGRICESIQVSTDLFAGQIFPGGEKKSIPVFPIKIRAAFFWSLKYLKGGGELVNSAMMLMAWIQSDPESVFSHITWGWVFWSLGKLQSMGVAVAIHPLVIRFGKSEAMVPMDHTEESGAGLVAGWSYRGVGVWVGWCCCCFGLCLFFLTKKSRKQKKTAIQTKQISQKPKSWNRTRVFFFGSTLLGY